MKKCSTFLNCYVGLYVLLSISANLLGAGVTNAADGQATSPTERAAPLSDAATITGTPQPNSAPINKNQWDNFEPPQDKKYDWIQLTSGEWLKGEFIFLYNYSVEFDSDELDLLKIDWDDIKQVRSARTMSLRIEEFINDEGPEYRPFFCAR